MQWEQQEHQQQQWELRKNHSQLYQQQQQLLHRQLNLLLQLQLYQQAQGYGYRCEDAVIMYYQKADGFIDRIKYAATLSNYPHQCILIGYFNKRNFSRIE